MLDLLIKKNEYNQLIILGSVITQRNIPKRQMVDALDLTSFTLIRYIRNINDEIHDIEPSKSVLINLKGDSINLINPNNLLTYPLFNKMLIKYLHESIIYQTLRALLFKNKQSTDRLIESLNISQSYFNKIIKSINEYFNSCQIQIIQRNKEIFFSGPETHILFLEFLIRHYFNKFETLPCVCQHYFPELIDLVNDHKLSDLNDIQFIRMTELHHIFKKRHDHLTSIKINDSEIKTVLETFASVSDLIVAVPDIPDFNTDMRLFANLLPRIMSLQLDSPLTKQIIGKKLASSSTTLSRDVVSFVNEIKSRFIKKMEVNSDDYFEFIYIAHLHLVYTKLFGYDFKPLFKLKHAHIFNDNRYEQTNYSQLVHYFNNPDNFANLNIINKIAIIQNQNLFIDSSYTALRSYRRAVVTISFDFMYRLSFEHFLQHRLQDIFSEKMLVFTKESENADILVTDHLVPVSQDTELFTFVDTNSNQSMDSLLATITAIYNKKISTTN